MEQELSVGRTSTGHPAVEVTTFIGDDGVPVVQIDTQPDAGRVRVNLNDAPIWDADPERNE